MYSSAYLTLIIYILGYTIFKTRDQNLKTSKTRFTNMAYYNLKNACTSDKSELLL